MLVLLLKDPCTHICLSVVLGLMDRKLTYCLFSAKSSLHGVTLFPLQQQWLIVIYKTKKSQKNCSGRKSTEQVTVRGQITCTTVSRNALLSDQNSPAPFTPGINVCPGRSLECIWPHRIVEWTWMHLNASWTATKDRLINCVIALAGKYVIFVRLFGHCTEHRDLCCEDKDDAMTAEPKATAFHTSFPHLPYLSFIYTYP